MKHGLFCLMAILTFSTAKAQDARTIQTGNFLAVWNTGVDTEAITTLEWLGSTNWTNTSFLNTCGNASNDVEFFGNSEAPPDPESGGLVLVGGGTITPPGTVAWSAQLLPAGIEQVTINSNSSNCPAWSAGINVQTVYRFVNPLSTNTNRFAVERVFDFSNAAFPYDFRPYIPRLVLNGGFSEVLYPTPSRTLATASVFNCGEGCTGPQGAPGAAPLSPPWDSTQGWFAMHNPGSLEGVIVSRVPSTDPQGMPIVAQLWIDSDAGSYTNDSSFLLMNPPANFSGGLVTEAETLCFYDSTIWTPSPVPPIGCRNGPLNPVSPSAWTITFAAQPVGMESGVQAVTLKNAGTEALAIAKIGANGDFAQTNDCPSKLDVGAACTIMVIFSPTETGIRSGSVIVQDLTNNDPQILSLAGLGLAAQAASSNEDGDRTAGKLNRHR